MNNEKARKTVKCEGRFHELRNYLYNHVIPTIMDERTLITKKDLDNCKDLISQDFASHQIYFYDAKDPYYKDLNLPGFSADILREPPNHEGLSLVPLIESPAYSLEKGLIRDYCISMGNSEKASKFLDHLSEHPLNFFTEIKREPKDIILPNKKNFSGYLISGNHGIGTIAQGGIKGGGIRSDSPFHLHIYKLIDRNETELAAVVGFWAQKNKMIVSQIQPCKNAKLPEGVPFGVSALNIAEIVARAIGLDEIRTYSARKHPIFREHPENWGQIGADFVFIYDNSTSKLNYEGSRASYHFKLL